MKVLVTGGAGFIGSHISRRLCSDGHSVRVLDNFSTGDRGNLRGALDNIEVIEGDIQSYERAHHAARGCELVFHQAALPSVPRSIQDPLTSNATNLIGTLNLLLAARDCAVRRVVFASSSSVYGASPALPKREGMPSLPISPYAVAKLASEGYCRSFSEVYGLETVSLRYFNVFGPYQDPNSAYAAVIPKFIAALRSGNPLIVCGDGEQSRDFTYVDNVVEANVCASTAEVAHGGVYNIACGEPVTVNELIKELETALHTPADVRHAEPRPGDVRNSFADVSKAESELGYHASIGFADGLRRTVAWYEHEAEAVSL